MQKSLTNLPSLHIPCRKHFEVEKNIYIWESLASRADFIAIFLSADNLEVPEVSPFAHLQQHRKTYLPTQ